LDYLGLIFNTHSGAERIAVQQNKAQPSISKHSGAKQGSYSLIFKRKNI